MTESSWSSLPGLATRVARAKLGAERPTDLLGTNFSIPEQVEALIEKYLEVNPEHTREDEFVKRTLAGDSAGATQTLERAYRAAIRARGATEAEIAELDSRIARVKYIGEAMIRANEITHLVGEHGQAIDRFYGDDQAFADLNNWTPSKEWTR